MARIVVVTPNPAIDVTYGVAEQRIGETVRVQSLERRAGGKGLNVVRVLAALGVRATAVQPLGGDSGRWLADALAQERIDAVTVPVPGDTRTTVAIVDGQSHPTLFAEPGAALSESSWRDLAAATGSAAEAGGFVVISGSVPPATRPEHVAALVEAGRSAGATVLVDTSGPALVAAAAAGAEYVMPNEGETLEASGATTLEDGMRSLLRTGAGTVLVSRGADGFLAIAHDGSHVRQGAVPRISGNPTGAGDAATAGFVAALAEGRTLAEATRSAAVLGAAAVLAPVAGEIDVDVLPELESRLDRDPSDP